MNTNMNLTHRPYYFILIIHSSVIETPQLRNRAAFSENIPPPFSYTSNISFWILSFSPQFIISFFRAPNNQLNRCNTAKQLAVYKSVCVLESIARNVGDIRTEYFKQEEKMRTIETLTASPLLTEYRQHLFS